MSKIPMPEAPEGYEWEKHGECVSPCRDSLVFDGQLYLLKPKKKLYDWAKTADYVWVTDKGLCGCHKKKRAFNPYCIIDCWLPHFGGPCPFDPEASIIEVMYRDGGSGDAKSANTFWWESDNEDCDIIALRFVRLADGYTWE